MKESMRFVSLINELKTIIDDPTVPRTKHLQRLTRALGRVPIPESGETADVIMIQKIPSVTSFLSVLLTLLVNNQKRKKPDSNIDVSELSEAVRDVESLITSDNFGEDFDQKLKNAVIKYRELRKRYVIDDNPDLIPLIYKQSRT